MPAPCNEYPLLIMMALNLMIGSVFSVIGGVIAFPITYEEYAKRFVDRRRAVKMALRMAVVTFLFFMFLSALLGLAFTYLF
jgi:uncharacterized membrane protein